VEREGELAAFVIALVKRAGGTVTLKASEIERAVLSTDVVHVQERIGGGYVIRVAKRGEVEAKEVDHNE
jgi:hypothetical protein